jgi:signal transduction histidine kinase
MGEPGREMEGRFSLVSLGHLAEETAVELMSVAQAKGHHVVLEIAPDALVMGDEVALRTLIRNLLDNASAIRSRQAIFRSRFVSRTKSASGDGSSS